jgi:hypothetical protein
MENIQMPTYDEWKEQATQDEQTARKYEELNERFKQSGLKVKAYIKERTSRNSFNEVIGIKFFARVDHLIKGKEFDADDDGDEIEDINLVLTEMGLRLYDARSTTIRYFDTKEKCEAALLPELIKYFIWDEYRSVVTNAKVITLGDVDV